MLTQYSSWWRHQTKIFSALLAFCAGNTPVICEFSSQRPVTRNFDVFFDLCLDKPLSKHSRRRWVETPLRSLWRHVMWCHDSMRRHIDGLVQERRKPSALAMELRLSCTNPSKYNPHNLSNIDITESQRNTLKWDKGRCLCHTHIWNMLALVFLEEESWIHYAFRYQKNDMIANRHSYFE